jgi:hypothetical protein
VDTSRVETSSELTVREDRTMELPRIEDPTSVEKNPAFKFRVEIPIVETNSLLTVREDRTMELPRIEDPVSVEN